MLLCIMRASKFDLFWKAIANTRRQPIMCNCAKQRGDLERYPGCRWASELPKLKAAIYQKPNCTRLCAVLNEPEPSFCKHRKPRAHEGATLHSSSLHCLLQTVSAHPSPPVWCTGVKGQINGRGKVLWILSWVQMGTALGSCNTSWRSNLYTARSGICALMSKHSLQLSSAELSFILVKSLSKWRISFSTPQQTDGYLYQPVLQGWYVRVLEDWTLPRWVPYNDEVVSWVISS